MGALTRACTILLVAICVLTVVLPASISATPLKTSANYTAHYALFDQIVTISIPPSLYTYYSNISHTIPRDSEYAKFITTHAVQPIADTIQTLTQNMPNAEEQFANAVLSLVHQIPYEITGAKFPIETIIDNQGDCGAVSLLAASIMKAGGLDVVLIKYNAADFAHMNVGVYLPYKPVYSSLFFGSDSLQYDNKSYWMAEATATLDWKVGDQPSQTVNTITQFISLNDSEQTSTGQVSCSLSDLSPSTITLDIFSKPLDVQMNRSLLLSGFIEPSAPNSSVTLYINKAGSFENYVKTFANNESRYSYLWNVTDDGTYYIVASYNGDATYAGTDSDTVAVFVGPTSPVLFQTDAYNYIVGISIGDIAIRPYLGVRDFLNASVGRNVTFSYSFCVLSTGQSPASIDTKKVTVPEKQLTVRDRFGRQHVFEVPAKTQIVPQNIPLGQQPLALPDDFNQTINNQFCFTTQKNPEGNYSLNAQALDSYDLNSIQQDSNIAFFNASAGITESTWYTITTQISDEGITADLKDQSSGQIHNVWAQHSGNSSAQLVLLVANNADSAIILKSFQVHDGTTLVEATPQVVHHPPPSVKSLLPFALAVVAIAALLIVTGVMIDVKKKRRAK